jgi:hypothetical protein
MVKFRMSPSLATLKGTKRLAINVMASHHRPVQVSGAKHAPLSHCRGL